MVLKKCKLIILCALGLGWMNGDALSIANPASENCVNVGGTLQIMKGPGGGEYGVCYFEDNKQCEEWALFRNECPLGGVRITGYTTPEGVYCAIKGGKPLENETQCQLFSGITCPSKDYYEGKCPETN